MANTKISADQVEELLLKGKSHGGVLTYREIMDSMQNVEDMTPDDMDSMYELIAQKRHRRSRPKTAMMMYCRSTMMIRKKSMKQSWLISVCLKG